MRTTPLLAVAAACLALAGCNTSSSGSNQATLDLCGLACPDDGGGSSSGGSSSGGSSSGGSSSGGSSSGGSSSGGGGTGGNTKLNGGDTTIALEAGALVSPSTGSYSRLTLTGDPDDPDDPKTAKFEIDTKQKGGAEWPTAIAMDEYKTGTIEPSLLSPANNFTKEYGHFLTDPQLNALNAAREIVAYYDPDTQSYYADYDPATEVYSNPVDIYDPSIQAQLITTNSNKLGSSQYREYRNISVSGGSSDEVLQVWNFGDKSDGSDSYATQYRSLGTGGEAGQQAFSFGGTKTPASEMPTSATANYVGYYGATVKAWNWDSPDTIDPEIGNIDPNGLFMVNEVAAITADFGAAKINGTLTPASWEFAQGDAWYYYEVDNNQLYVRGQFNKPIPVTNGQFVPDYFTTRTNIKGSIAGNSYSGIAELEDGFVNGDNPMYGAFFGTGAKETTGIFSVLGVRPQPIGGEYPINDDRRAYVQQSGIFNAKCQAGGACTP